MFKYYAVTDTYILSEESDLEDDRIGWSDRRIRSNYIRNGEDWISELLAHTCARMGAGQLIYVQVWSSMRGGKVDSFIFSNIATTTQ